MKRILQYGTANFEISNSNNNHFVTEWNLMNRVITLHKEDSGIRDQNEISNNTFGSSEWLWDEADVFRFDNITKKPISLKFKLPYSTEFTDLSVNNLSENVITLIPSEFKDFPSQSSESACYNPEMDQLFCFYSQTSKFEESTFFALNRNLQFIVEQTKIIGWVLNKASECVGTSEHSKEFNLENKSLLKDYLGLCNENTFELMEDESNSVKLKLKNLKQLVSSQKNPLEIEIFNAVSGFLSGYYD